MEKILIALAATSFLIATAFASNEYEVGVTASAKLHHSYAPKPAPKVDTTVVQGYVYCESCEGKWVKHLAGAKVMVQCKNYINSHGSDLTDEYGFYQIKLPHQYSAESCTANIVSSSDKSCKIATNVGNGQKGAAVTYLKTFYNEIFFKTSPFAFKQACHGPKY